MVASTKVATRWRLRLQVAVGIWASVRRSFFSLGVSWVRAGPRLTPRCGRRGHARSLACADERACVVRCLSAVCGWPVASPYLVSSRYGFHSSLTCASASCATWRPRLPALARDYAGVPVVGNEGDDARASSPRRVQVSRIVRWRKVIHVRVKSPTSSIERVRCTLSIGDGRFPFRGTRQEGGRDASIPFCISIKTNV